MKTRAIAEFALLSALAATGAQKSCGFAFPDGVRAPGYTLLDALAELNWDKWHFALNAANVFDKKFYAACLARGDCFMGEAQNIFGTLTYRY